VNVILQRHPIHSAISLIVVMIALAGLFLTLYPELVERGWTAQPIQGDPGEVRLQLERRM
jgi:hypothetical protein